MRYTCSRKTHCIGGNHFNFKAELIYEFAILNFRTDKVGVHITFHLGHITSSNKGSWLRDQIYFNCFKQSTVKYFLPTQFQINVKWFTSYKGMPDIWQSFCSPLLFSECLQMLLKNLGSQSFSLPYRSKIVI